MPVVMGKQFKIEIESIDLGQILDGLRSRQESWKNTAVYLREFVGGVERVVIAFSCRAVYDN